MFLKNKLTYSFFSIAWMILIFLSYHLIDKPLAYFIGKHQSTYLADIAEYVTELGVSGYYIGGLLLLYLLLRFTLKRPQLSEDILFLLKIVILTGLLCLFFKITLSRARPIGLFNQDLFGFFFFKTKAAFWSFPSGHAATISAVMLGLCVLLPRYCAWFIISLAIISFTRVMVNAHYLSDVLAGIYLASFVVFWMNKFRYTFRHEKPYRFNHENQ